MARQSFISHAVNGYSRYDLPESKAFSCTPGILYPVRVDYVNPRDRITIDQGIDVRSNPLQVPSFNPYVIRLHRFFVPLQLYHPEMRTNSSEFDMNSLSFNFVPYVAYADSEVTQSGVFTSGGRASVGSLFHWLRIGHRPTLSYSNLETWTPGTASAVLNLPGPTLKASPVARVGSSVLNADTYLAYWDIVRNYYSYSQWGLYSFAWPSSWYLVPRSQPSSDYPAGDIGSELKYLSSAASFAQRYGNLQFLDAYYESQFYPSAIESDDNTYNRSNLWRQILFSDLESPDSSTSGGYPVPSGLYPVGNLQTGVATFVSKAPSSFYSVSSGDHSASLLSLYSFTHPMAVVPSSPDRFSRLLPPGTSASAVSMSNVTTIPQLAVASRLQEYKDLLGAGGSRFSDWLETFFASRIEHVDRPKLLFSASQTVNVQVIMNQTGVGYGFGSTQLGQMGGSIAFNTKLGKSQTYYFKEPGYLIDMLSIRPVYYWSGIRPDYLSYQGADYFNPVYNDIGYQNLSASVFAFSSSTTTVAQEPCYNEFRSSYDEVLGALSTGQSYSATIGQPDSPKDPAPTALVPLYSYWVQQRYLTSSVPPNAVGPVYQVKDYYKSLFVDMSSVNSPFLSQTEDNFFVNLSYSVRKKNLVNKTFATRLSNR